MIVLKKMGGIRLPALVALCAATLMLVSLLMFPYVATPGGYNPRSTPDAVDEVDESSYSMLSLSLYLRGMLADSVAVLGWIYVALFGVCSVFCLCAMLFALMDKATPTGIFALLSWAPFYLYSLDLTQRGFIGGSHEWSGYIYYDWGFGYYLFYIGMAIAVGAAVWLFVEKFLEKRTEKAKRT